MFTHDLPPTYTAMVKQCTWDRLVSIEWQLHFAPFVSSYYTETNILHYRSCILVHPHHLEIIRTHQTRVTQYQWHIKGWINVEWLDSLTSIINVLEVMEVTVYHEIDSPNTVLSICRDTNMHSTNPQMTLLIWMNDHRYHPLLGFGG